MSSPTFELNHKVVRAGAGAGKTTNLTESVVGLAEGFLKSESRLPNFVVTTFTRKATEELRERITSKLFESNKEDLIGLVQSRQHLQISTIHGVLSLFLRQYGQLVGLEAGFKVADGIVSKKIAKKVLHDLLPSMDCGPSLLEAYSFETLLEILMERRRRKIEFPDLSSFDRTDFKKASENYIQLKIGELPKVLKLIYDETDNEKWKDYVDHFQNILASAKQDFDFVKAGEALKAFGRKPSFAKKKPPFSELLKDQFEEQKKNFDKLATQTSLRIESYEEFERFAEWIEQVGVKFDHQLKQEKYSSGQIDSEDLELFSLEILRAEPELGSAFASQWDYWLVDEYQDTSPLQVEIMEKLRGDRPVYVVGDPQQSIYLFRGARMEVFDQEEERIKKVGGESEKLSKNFRSRPELLSAINDLVVDLGPNFSGMEPRDNDFDSQAEVLQIAKVDQATEEPYNVLAKYIFEKLEQGAKLDDFCVLAKANNTLLRVARSFEELGLSCSVHAASGFYSRREVMDLMSLLKFLVNPHDNLNFVRLLRAPWFHFDDSKIVDLASSKSVSYWLEFAQVYASEAVAVRLSKGLHEAEEVGFIESFRRLVFESGLIDLSHFHDSTGRRESNIWKLLTELRSLERNSGFNPVEVFRKFERALHDEDDESDAVASKEPNRINLMTIHKSKGLKFKYVILPNMEKVARLSKSRGHDSPLICSETDKKWSSYIPMGSSAEMKHSASALLALEELSERERAESLRLLYVAMTRAEEGLCLHAISKDDTYPEFSWASQLSVFRLATGVEGKQNYSIRVIDGNLSESQAISRSALNSKDVRSPYEYIKSDRALRRFSVTSLVEGLKAGAPAKQKNSDVEQVSKSVRAPSLGSILHEVFERMRYQNEFDVIRYLSDKLGDNADAFIESVDYVTSLEKPPMSSLITSGEVEWGFQVKTDRGILEGQVDLWCEHNNEVWVLDYKSGSTRHSEKAFEQLKYYAWALHKAFDYKEFKLAVVYPLAKEVKIETFRNPAQWFQEHWSK